MKQKRNRRTSRPRRVLRLLDLEHARAAVLNSLSSRESQRGYRHAIDEFVDWYCSEPRLAFNRVVVLRYRSHLESRRLAPGTINLRLGAVRRLAYEAADCGLLSSDLAAGIRRVKGLKKNGVRMGNWLTAEQAGSLWRSPDTARMKGKRDRALLALLLACGLRRHEAANLRVEDLQQREDHWAIVDLVGKAGHIRTVPIPDWVYVELVAWLSSASIHRGKVFRRISRMGRVLGDGISEKAIWHVVRSSALKVGIAALAPHDLRRTCARLCRSAGGELDQIQLLLGHVSIQTTEQYLGSRQSFVGAQWYRVVPFALRSPDEFRDGLARFGPATYGSRAFREQAEELVKKSANLDDRQKMIAEYFADGPHSELPPGHWNLFAQFVSARDHHGLDEDVKLFFALTNAIFDAGIVAWDAKHAFDSVRPATAVPFLFQAQQIQAWGGPGKGTVTMDGRFWIPYQLSTFPTPPFPEFISGHSTFSAAGAAVLRLFTGSDAFGDSVTFPAGSSKIEPGFTPSDAITLRWETFTDAANQAGISRRYGGIHFKAADLTGRVVGQIVGDEAYREAERLWRGRK